MPTIEPIHVGPDAIERLCDYCVSAHAGLPVVLVADTRTFAAAGQKVNRALVRAGVSVTDIVLSGDNIHADEVHLSRVLTSSPAGERLFVAVGSGTITDITRYISFRLGMRFVSVPTGASVDGFASTGAPLVIEGIKRTYAGQPPAAIFADSNVLAAAPTILTASGFGDLIGKITSIADWRLGALLRDEPYDERIAQRTIKAVESCTADLGPITRKEPEGVTRLFNALTETGLCMLDFGESRPASGAEHHISHFWEMTMLRLGMPTPLHGMQVGIATVAVAHLYRRIRALDAGAAEALFAGRLPLGGHDQESEIHAAYGSAATTIIRDHADYLEQTADEQLGVAERIVSRWDDVQEIARTVPEPEAVLNLLQEVGAPVDGQLLGLPADQLRAGIVCGHYLRSRFTSAKLCHMLGVLGSPS